MGSITKVAYLHGTFETYTYDKLDLASYKDRQSRIWLCAHDANRRLTSITDPGAPKTNVTQWTYDVQGRLPGTSTPTPAPSPTPTRPPPAA